MLLTLTDIRSPHLKLQLQAEADPPAAACPCPPCPHLKLQLLVEADPPAAACPCPPPPPHLQLQRAEADLAAVQGQVDSLRKMAIREDVRGRQDPFQRVAMDLQVGGESR